MSNNRTPKAASRVLPYEESQVQESVGVMEPAAPGAIVANMNTDVGILPIVASTKNFKTGSRGFYGVSKVVIGGRRYQVSLQLVEIGSKGK